MLPLYVPGPRASSSGNNSDSDLQSLGGKSGMKRSASNSNIMIGAVSAGGRGGMGAKVSA